MATPPFWSALPVPVLPPVGAAPAVLRVPAGALPMPEAPVAVDPAAPDEDGALEGAMAAIFATDAQAAALFVAASPCLYGRKETAPALSSWTSALMLAAYCAFGSFVAGAGIVAVELFSTLITYVAEPSSGMNANSCWMPVSWKKEAVLPCAAGNEGPPLAPG